MSLIVEQPSIIIVPASSTTSLASRTSTSTAIEIAGTDNCTYMFQSDNWLFNTPSTTVHTVTSTSSGSDSRFCMSSGSTFTSTNTGWSVVTGGSNSTIYCNVYYTTTDDYVPHKVNYAKMRKQKRSVQQSIKRALKLITGLGYGKEIGVFLGGSSIEVSHHESDFKLVMTPHPESLIYRTKFPGYSTPYKLELYTKSDVFLAKLCVILNDTPILDQVLAMSLLVKSGEEDMLLEEANFSSITQDRSIKEWAAEQKPFLAKKLRLSDINVENSNRFITSRDNLITTNASNAFETNWGSYHE